jgi:anti-sigma factor RsiW
MKDSSKNGQCGILPITVHAFADNELNAMDCLAFKDHLRACPYCFATYRRILLLKAIFKHSLLQYQAPVSLRIAVTLALQSANKAAPAGVSGAKRWNYTVLSRPGLIWREWKQINWIASALAASLLLAVTLIFSSIEPALEDEIIANYKRSLVVSLPSNHPSATSDEEMPRLAGKLDFVPPITDLAGSGFTYNGTRFDQIGSHSGAVLVYTRESYVIDLYIWPSEAEPLDAVSREGYNIIRWTRSGLKFCAISTMNAKELSRFQKAFASMMPA